jgi:hypothetical protein
MEIFVENLPYSAWPAFYTEPEEIITYFLDDNKLCKIEDNRRIFYVPLRTENLEGYCKKFDHPNSIWQKIKNWFYKDNMIVEQINSQCKLFTEFHKQLKLKRTIPKNIIELFENIGCYQLTEVSKEESFTTFSDKIGIKCIWYREVGYFGFKLK